MHLGVQVSKTLARLIVQTFTTDVSNHLINFPMCTECKKEGQKPIKRPKLSIGTVLHCLFKIIELLILLLETGNKIIITSWGQETMY